MKAREMGRFLSEFLDGFTEGSTGNSQATPAVVPVEQLKAVVLEVLPSMLEAMAAEQEPAADPAREAQQLSMMFQDAGEGGGDPIAEATLRRVHEAQERAAREQREARNGAAVPEMYDPNDPGSTKPWTAPILRET